MELLAPPLARVLRPPAPSLNWGRASVPFVAHPRSFTMSGDGERMRRRFIWRFGVLGWGLPVAVAWAAAFWWIADPRPSFWVALALALALFPVGGYAWGALMWRWARGSAVGPVTDTPAG